MTDDRDLVVARALRELPVPDHGPGFWEELEARLAAEAPRPEVPAAPGPSPDRRVSTAELPAIGVLRLPAAAPRVHRVRFVAAAAVLALVAVGTALVLRGDPDGGGELAATTTVPPSEQATAFGAPGPPPSPDTIVPTATTRIGAPDPRFSASETVLAFVRALGAGNADEAAALFGPRSLAYVAAQGTTAERYALELQEGYGAWAGVSDLSTFEVPIPGEGVVVILEGTYQGEGLADPSRIDALPAVPLDDGAFSVEPAAFGPDTGGRLEIVVPESGEAGWSGVAPDAVLQAGADGDVTYWFCLDEEVPQRSRTGTWKPPAPMTPGYHRLVVAAVGTDTFTALAGSFLVES